jgi:hypothetical protein
MPSMSQQPPVVRPSAQTREPTTHTTAVRHSTMTRHASAALIGGIALTIGLAGCQETGPVAAEPTAPSQPLFTASVGSQGSVLGRATFADPFHVNRKLHGHDGWEIDIKAKAPVDVAVQSITFAPGGYSGWHSHPGPVFIQVVSGTVTFYESDDPHCAPIVRTAGQGYLDVGDHAHFARNEGTVPATNVVTYFVPVGAPLRIDEPSPGNCPF